ARVLSICRVPMYAMCPSGNMRRPPVATIGIHRRRLPQRTETSRPETVTPGTDRPETVTPGTGKPHTVGVQGGIIREIFRRAACLLLHRYPGNRFPGNLLHGKRAIGTIPTQTARR